MSLRPLLLLALISPALASPRPNLVFLFSDDHLHHALGVSDPTLRTPHLDALAGSGVRFTHAIAATAICSPARAAVLTGRYGTRNGVPVLSRPLRFPRHSVAHALADAGYRTAQFGKWHLGTTPAEAGFADYARIDGNGSWFVRRIDSNLEDFPTQLDGIFFERFFADAAIEWIDHHCREHPEQPFFLWWCHQVPHLDGKFRYPDVRTAEPAENRPWGSPGGFRERIDLAAIEVPKNWRDDLSTKPPYLTESRYLTHPVEHDYGGPGGYSNPAPGKRHHTLGQDHVQQHTLEHHAALAALDAEIGRLLARLGDPDGDGDPSDSILDRTWIVFMGDNGWQLGHRKFTSKVLAYEESIRVPLIVKAPGVAPRVDPALVLNLDLTSMFLSLAGLEIPERLQGRDLARRVRDPGADWRDALYYEAVVAPEGLGSRPTDALRTASHKLIHTYAPDRGTEPDDPPAFVELYDLEADPHELDNLADDPAHAARRAELARRLATEKHRIATTPGP